MNTEQVKNILEGGIDKIVIKSSNEGNPTTTINPNPDAEENKILYLPYNGGTLATQDFVWEQVASIPPFVASEHSVQGVPNSHDVSSANETYTCSKLT